MAIQVVGMFCEDIREEKNGQSTLIGILPDNIQLPAVPESLKGRAGAAAIIPKIGLYARLLVPTDDRFVGPMKFYLTMPDGSRLDFGDLDTELIAKSKQEASDSGLPIAGVIFTALMQGFQTPAAGLITAMAEYGDTKQPVACLNVKAAVKV